MADVSRKIIEQATKKIQLLEEQKALLEQEVEILRETEAKYKQLQRDYDRLRLAKAFEASEGDKDTAYNRLTGLIRRVENCLEIVRNQ